MLKIVKKSTLKLLVVLLAAQLGSIATLSNTALAHDGDGCTYTPDLDQVKELVYRVGYQASRVNDLAEKRSKTYPNDANLKSAVNFSRVLLGKALELNDLIEEGAVSAEEIQEQLFPELEEVFVKVEQAKWKLQRTYSNDRELKKEFSDLHISFLNLKTAIVGDDGMSVFL
jgi:hypothetical protein